MLDCVGLNSEHTVDNLREVLEETWKLDLSNMASITCDDASANKKQDFTQVPPALSIAINKGLDHDEPTCWDSLYEIVEIFFSSRLFSSS